jgi:hypothetical protein
VVYAGPDDPCVFGVRRKERARGRHGGIAVAVRLRNARLPAPQLGADLALEHALDGGEGGRELFDSCEGGCSLLRVMMRGKGGEESLELRKKVKIDNIVELYATLLSKLSPF